MRNVLPTDLHGVLTSKGRVDTLPTTLQVFGIGFGLPVLATIGIFVARTTRVIA